MSKINVKVLKGEEADYFSGKALNELYRTPVCSFDKFDGMTKAPKITISNLPDKLSYPNDDWDF